MPNQEFALQKVPERIPLSTVQKVTLREQGLVDFQNAINIAARIEGSDAVNALVGVAANMVEVEISPVPVLERLTLIRGGISTRNDKYGERRRNRSFIELGMADIYGMLGEVKKFPDLLESPERDDCLWAISPYIYAGEAFIKQGQDPTPILDQAMDRIAKSKPHYNNHFKKTIEFVRVAGVFHKAGLDPNVAFNRGIKTIEAARQVSSKESFDYRSYRELAIGYASCGMADDALRMVDLIGRRVRKVDGGDWEEGQALQKIAEVHLRRDDYEAALVVARRLNRGDLTAKILTNRAISEAKQGIPPFGTITEVTAISEDLPPLEAVKNVFPKLGVALELSGKTEDAQHFFRKALVAIDGLDVFDKAFAGFELARGLDEAGYEATSFYRKSFGWIEQFKIEERELDSMFNISGDMYERGIRNLIAGGYFDLAKKYMQGYPDVSTWNRSILIADLAEEEIRSGSPEGI